MIRIGIDSARQHRNPGLRLRARLRSGTENRHPKNQMRRKEHGWLVKAKRGRGRCSAAQILGKAAALPCRPEGLWGQGRHFGLHQPAVQKEDDGKKMLAARGWFCYCRRTIHIMRTFSKSACLVLLAAWAGSALSSAQTNPAAATTNSPAAATKMPTRRFSGKILSVDVKAKTITLQGGAKAVVVITDKTRIIKAKKPAAFDALAADQAVTGIEQMVAAGIWQAETLTVGDPRGLLEAPVPKTFVAPAASFMFSVSEVKDWPGFVKRLREHSDAVSAFLWQGLASQDQEMLMNYPLSGPDTKPAQDAVIKFLNKVIAEQGLYQDQRFQGVSLRPETMELAKRSPADPNVARLNRLLLEDAYPLELPKLRR
jgi:hypothetical protein